MFKSTSFLLMLFVYIYTLNFTNFGFFSIAPAAILCLLSRLFFSNKEIIS